MRLIQLLLAAVVIHRSIVGGEHAEHIEDDTDLADMLDEQELEHSMREEIIDLPVDTELRSIDIAAVRTKLANAIQSEDLPDEITEVMAALESAVGILKCIPTRKDGDCYTSAHYCDIKTSGFTVEIKPTICKSPWSLRIDFKVPKDLKEKIPSLLKPLVYIDVAPVILTLDHKKDEGITQINYRTRIAAAGLKLLFIKIGYAKVYFSFDLTVRWDCTLPEDDHVTRLKYNIDFDDGKSGNDMNKLYYKLKIGYEVKTKRFPCFCYKCKKCETILNKQGYFGEGPDSCKSDWSEWNPASCRRRRGWFWRRRRSNRTPSPTKKTRTCVGQDTGGPPCPGSSFVNC